MPAKVKHDRTILTNYKMYTSGDSFKYFRDGKNVALCTHGDWLYINSLHKKGNLQNAKDYIHDLQDIIDSLKNRLDTIMGDKKSHFLKF